MTLRRRNFLQLAASAAALPAVSRIALAQTYPTRPVKLIVTVPAGGSPDIIARLIAQWLSEKLGQHFIVENKPGASTNFGTEAGAQGGAGRLHAAARHVLQRDQRRALHASEFQLHARHRAGRRASRRIPLVMVVNPSVAGEDRPRIHRLRQSQSRQDQHGVRRHRHAAYRRRRAVPDDGRRRTDRCALSGRGPALSDLLSGQVQVMFAAMPASLGYIKAGKLRALAVTSANAQPSCPMCRR